MREKKEEKQEEEAGWSEAGGRKQVGEAVGGSRREKKEG